MAFIDDKTVRDLFEEDEEDFGTDNLDASVREEFAKVAERAFSKYPDPTHPLKLSEDEARVDEWRRDNANALRDALNENNETAASLANELEVSRQTVSAWVSKPETVPAVYVVLLRNMLKVEISTMRGVPVCPTAVDPYGSPMTQDNFLMIWGTLDQSDRLTLETVACALFSTELGRTPKRMTEKYKAWLELGLPQLAV